MKEITLSAIGDTIKNFEEKIAQAQTLWEKVQIFFDTYKVWILVGLVVLVGIIFFVNIMEAKKRKDDRDCATDREGILGRISTVFGKNKIGIEKVFQNEENVNSKTDIIFVTHLSHEKIIEKALKEITALDGVKNVAALIRVEE